MVELTTESGNLVVAVQGADKLWAFKSRLEIPLAHIKSVYADPAPAMGWFQGLKLMGTDMPNWFRAGTFYQQGGLVFWDVHNPQKTIVIELHDEHYQKLIVEVAEPDAAIRFIEGELTARTGGQPDEHAAARAELEAFLNGPQ